MDRFTGLSTLLRHRRLGAVAGAWLAILFSFVALPFSTDVNAATAPQISSSCNAMANSVATAPTTDQLITVVAPSLRSTTASLDVFKRVGSCFHLAEGPFGAEVGGNGLSSHHREGDDTTPIGLFTIQSTMYGVDTNPGVAYRYHHLVCGDWWDEQSSTALYNHFVHVPCGTKPDFGGGSEALWQTVPSYDYFAVIAYNRHPIVPGNGSAIFLHVSSGQPTAGCVSIPVADLLRVLRTLRPSLRPLIDISMR